MSQTNTAQSLLKDLIHCSGLDLVSIAQELKMNRVHLAKIYHNQISNPSHCTFQKILNFYCTFLLRKRRLQQREKL